MGREDLDHRILFREGRAGWGCPQSREESQSIQRETIKKVEKKHRGGYTVDTSSAPCGLREKSEGEVYMDCLTYAV